MEKNKKVLIKIRNLKQYFPLKKNNKRFVRANDGINLDIYEGETLGLVGESGCGKSTLGRVLLQLYHQTAGDTIFSGRDLYSLAPKYIKAAIDNLEKKKTVIESLLSQHDIIKSFNTPVDVTITLITQGDKSIEKELRDIIKIFGGLVVSKEIDTIIAVHNALYSLAKECYDKNQELSELTLTKEESPANAPKLSEVNSKITALKTEIAAKQKEIDAKKAEIQKMRVALKSNAQFEAYEAYRADGIDLTMLTYPEMRHLRRDIQLIFQDPYSSLNPRMTVGQIIGEGLKAHRIYSKESEKYNAYITDVMNKCGLAPYMIHRYPHQFSGGQRQRIGIARTLAVRPKFVVCDEAVSALDVSIQSQIINLLQDLKEKENLTYLFISHDLSVVKYISDRIGVMYLGNIVELAEKEDIFANPMHPYTEALLSAIPTTDTEKSNRKEFLLEGDIPSPINPPSGCKFHTRCRYAKEQCKTDIPEFREVKPNHFVACHFCLDNGK